MASCKFIIGVVLMAFVKATFDVFQNRDEGKILNGNTVTVAWVEGAFSYGKLSGDLNF
jgi:hypothetical protein